MGTVTGDAKVLSFLAGLAAALTASLAVREGLIGGWGWMALGIFLALANLANLVTICRFRHPPPPPAPHVLFQPGQQILVNACGLPPHVYLPYSLDKESLERSRELLRGRLDPNQLRDFDRMGTFEVCGSDRKRYVITQASSYSVHCDGWRYCAYPHGPLPIYDRMLGQKLLIEADAKAFKRIAFKTSDYR